MNVLDTRFDALRLRLRSCPRSYDVRLEGLWVQRLNEGLIEYGYDDPESLSECTSESLDPSRRALASL